MAEVLENPMAEAQENPSAMAEAQENPPAMASVHQPTDEDYNQPSRERSELLQRLHNALGAVNPHFWAACYVCDIWVLQTMTQHSEIMPNHIHTIAEQTYAMVSNWNQTSRMPGASTPLSASSGSASSPPGEPPIDTNSPPAKRRKLATMNRSRAARGNAAQRDNNHCVLTGRKMIEVAHIYPYYLLNKEDVSGKRHAFWRMLGNFWPQQKIAAWKSEVFPNGFSESGIETPANMITLAKESHGLWNKGEFALKPLFVSDDKTALTIQFFWQARFEQITQTMSLLTVPPTTRDFQPPNDTNVYDSQNNRLIRSGDVFILTTDDPEARPLPSMVLLEMQWFLQRVMGMAGAADDVEDFKGDSDDWRGEGVMEWVAGTRHWEGEGEKSDCEKASSSNSESGDATPPHTSDPTVVDSSPIKTLQQAPTREQTAEQTEEKMEGEEFVA